jgi:hypothetical protein
MRWITILSASVVRGRLAVLALKRSSGASGGLSGSERREAKVQQAQANEQLALLEKGAAEGIVTKTRLHASKIVLRHSEARWSHRLTFERRMDDLHVSP